MDAEQWFPGKTVAGVFGEVEASKAPDGAYFPAIAYVRTIHGQATQIKAGDWVITEHDGKHHYPCKPEIFQATYEAV